MSGKKAKTITVIKHHLGYVSDIGIRRMSSTLNTASVNINTKNDTYFRNKLTMATWFVFYCFDNTKRLQRKAIHV